MRHARQCGERREAGERVKWLLPCTASATAAPPPSWLAAGAAAARRGVIARRCAAQRRKARRETQLPGGGAAISGHHLTATVVRTSVPVLRDATIGQTYSCVCCADVGSEVKPNLKTYRSAAYHGCAHPSRWYGELGGARNRRRGSAGCLRVKRRKSLHYVQRRCT